MSLIRSENTKPEIQTRKALHRLGFRFRLHEKSLPGKPDIVLPKYKAAIQVRGCFWHGHNCKVGHLPASRTEYWTPKITRNAKRDEANDSLLRKSGWRVFVVWECACRKPQVFAQEIGRIVSGLRRNSDRLPRRANGKAKRES